MNIHRNTRQAIRIHSRSANCFTTRLFRQAVLIAAAAAASFGAQAQDSMVPSAGQWEVSSAATGMPRGGEPVTRSVCLTTASFKDGVEAAFRKAVTEESRERGPECKYEPTGQQPGTSSWNASCKGGPMTLAGSGQATWTATSFSLNEKLGGKSSFMGELNIQRTITGRRTGDCTK
ncbi:MAG: DUF3617 domain-containing protein [Burkholderiaceae bacterium]